MRKSLATVAMAFGLILISLPAMASHDIVIPVDTVVRGAEGDTFVLATEPTDDDAGCEARVTATADNNESVHAGNDLIVASGSDQVVLSDVESEPGKHTVANTTLMLGDTITVTLRLGPPDAGRPISVFSGGITVHVSCVPQETTTTTTTEATSTTTTVPSTTTTLPVTTSSMLNTTTTTAPQVSSTVVSTTTTVPPIPGSTLPFTGPGGVGGLAMVGGALLLLGGGLMVSLRERSA